MALCLRVKPFLWAFFATFEAESYPTIGFKQVTSIRLCLLALVLRRLGNYEPFVQQSIDPLLICLNTFYQILFKAPHSIT